MSKLAPVKTRVNSGRRGFTLIEVMLSLALFGVLVAAAYPVYQSLAARADLDRTVETTVHALRRAELLARGVAGDGPWGVDVAPAQITIFQGSSYAARNRSFDEFTDLPGTVSASGTLDVIFTSFTGEPTAVGAITFAPALGQGGRLITWNAKGIITY